MGTGWAPIRLQLPELQRGDSGGTGGLGSRLGHPAHDRRNEVHLGVPMGRRSPSYGPRVSGLWIAAEATSVCSPTCPTRPPGGLIGPRTASNSVFTADSEPPPAGCCGVGNRDVYVINADGTGVKRLTYAAGEDRGPAFSPDGRLIVFTSQRPGHGELYLMRRDGRDQTRLTRSAPRDLGESGPPSYDSYLDASWQPLPRIAKPCDHVHGRVRFTNPQCKRTVPRGQDRP